MAEDALLKYAQPVLIGIGLIVVLNLWNVLQLILTSRSNKDKKIEKTFEKLNETVMKLSFKVEQISKDLNNIGRIIREMRNK